MAIFTDDNTNGRYTRTQLAEMNDALSQLMADEDEDAAPLFLHSIEQHYSEQIMSAVDAGCQSADDILAYVENERINLIAIQSRARKSQ